MQNENDTILSDLGLDLGYSSQRFDDFQNETACMDSHRDLIYAAMAGNEAAVVRFGRLVRLHLGIRWASKLAFLGVDQQVISALCVARLEHTERMASNRARQHRHSTGRATIDFDQFGPLHYPEAQEVSW